MGFSFFLSSRKIYKGYYEKQYFQEVSIIDFWTGVIIAWHKRGMSAKEIANMFGWKETDVQKVIDDYSKK